MHQYRISIFTPEWTQNLRFSENTETWRLEIRQKKEITQDNKIQEIQQQNSKYTAVSLDDNKKGF